MDHSYDTDTISLTSTLDDQENGEQLWDVEDILAEAQGQNGQSLYLVKWDGFPMSECTWEPYEHIEESSLPQMWEERKRGKSAPELEKYINDIIDEFEEAVQQAADAKALRRMKRAKKRNKLARRRHESDSNDDGLFISKRKMAGTRPAQSVSSTKQSLRDEAEEVGHLSLRGSRMPRKPPLEQPSSSGSEESDDSLIKELKANARKNSKMVAKSEGRRKSTQGQPPLKASASVQNMNFTSAPRGLLQANTQEEGLPSRASRPLRHPRPPRPPQPPASAFIPSKSTASGAKTSTSVVKGPIERHITMPTTSVAASTPILSTARGPTTADASNQLQRCNRCGKTFKSPDAEAIGKHQRSSQCRPRQNSLHELQEVTPHPNTLHQLSQPGIGGNARNTAIASIRRSAPGATGAIRMVNQAPAVHRKEWTNSDKQYKTLSMRRNAEVRSIREKVPDPAALVFVNGPPTVNPGASVLSPVGNQAIANDDVYGRRETRRRPIQDKGQEERRPSVPPAWEADKVQMTCWEWRNGSCRFTAERCRLLHRASPNIPICVNGKIPPKLKKPTPVTCYFYLKGVRGCKHDPEECGYAHWNTGLLGHPNGDVQIDPNERPIVEGFTCYFWAQGTCSKSEESCKYSHRHTGRVADPPARLVRKNQTTFNDAVPETSPQSPNPKRQASIPGVLMDIDQASGSFLPDSAALVLDPSETTAKSPASENPFITGGSIVHDPRPSIALPEAPLVMPPKPPALQSPAKISATQLNATIQTACQLNFENIFQTNEDPNLYLTRRAFLVFHPEEHAEEMELITRWLLMHHVEVCGFWVEGSWDYFKQIILDGGSGVILTHPDFDAFADIPEFGKILRSKVRIWSVGYQTATEYDPQRSVALIPPRVDCIEIFPHGGYIYITDEVFEERPIEALRILELFVAKVDRCRSVKGAPLDVGNYVDDGCLLWRIATRPELMRTTFDWCMAHQAEVDADEPLAQSRAKLYDLLSRCNYIEQDDNSAFVLRPDDYWPIISERREIAVDYYEALTRSQDEAICVEIQLYAETVVDLRRDYRSLIVVHTRPSKVDWQQRFQHMDEIMTPEKCIEYLEQPAEGNRFDFYEWAYDEKPRDMELNVDRMEE